MYCERGKVLGEQVNYTFCRLNFALICYRKLQIQKKKKKTSTVNDVKKTEKKNLYSLIRY